MRSIVIRACRRRDVLGLLLLQYATIPSSSVGPLGLAREYFSLQQRLEVNHVVVASDTSGLIVGSVEVHSVQYLRKQAGNAYSSAQAALLQPYLCSMQVREHWRRQGIGRALVLRALKDARAAAPPGSSIFLNVEASNVGAINMYRSRSSSISIQSQRLLGSDRFTLTGPPSLFTLILTVPHPSPSQVVRVQGERWRRQSIDAEASARASSCTC